MIRSDCQGDLPGNVSTTAKTRKLFQDMPDSKDTLSALTKLIFMSASVLLFLACASGHRPPFDGQLPQVRDIDTLERRLTQAVSTSQTLTLEVVADVDYPYFHAPIWRVSHRPAHTHTKTVLVNAGIHGNEPAGVESALKLVEYIASHPQEFSAMAVDVIPLINPWGWTHDIRFNRTGIDINRDFSTFDSQEARLVAAAVAGRQYDLMLDLHEDPSAAGFYLYQYGLATKIFSQGVVESVRKMGYPIEQNISMVILKTENGIIDAPMWGLYYMRLTGQLSLANHYRLYNSRHVFTIETPTSLPFQDRITIQQRVVNMFIHTYHQK
jgi:hypothetical protein